MAEKTIPELEAATSYGDAAVIPMDSGVQTFKVSKEILSKGLQKWTAFYDAVIGSADYCTHATIAAALADVNLTTNVRVLLTASATLAASVALNKAGWIIEALPGVTYTAGAATVAFLVTAARVEIRGLRFVGFTTGVNLSTGSNYCRVVDCLFNTTTTDVTDSTGTAALYGNIPE